MKRAYCETFSLLRWGQIPPVEYPTPVEFISKAPTEQKTA